MGTEYKDVLRVEGVEATLVSTTLRNKQLGFGTDGQKRMIHKMADGTPYYWVPEGYDVTYGNITIGEYIYHDGDVDTYLRFTDNAFDIVAGAKSYIYNNPTGVLVLPEEVEIGEYIMPYTGGIQGQILSILETGIATWSSGGGIGETGAQGVTGLQGVGLTGLTDGYLVNFDSTLDTLENSPAYTNGSYVGINTTTPLTDVEVKGLAGYSSTLTISGSNTISDVGQEYAALQFRSGDTSIAVPDDICGKIAMVSEDASGTTSAMIFYTANAGIPPFSERMRIKQDGTINFSTVANAGVDTDKFLVLDATDNVDFRTGAQVLSDIDGVGGSGTTNYITKFTAASTVGNSIIYDNGTNASIGTTSALGRFDVSYGGVDICVGADFNLTTRTNATLKVGMIAAPHYTNAEETVVGYLQSNDASNNYLSLGGGFFNNNAATDIIFYAAANNTTLGGDAIARITTNGLSIGGTPVAWHSNYSVLDLRSGYGIIYGASNGSGYSYEYGQAGIANNTVFDGTYSRAIGTGGSTGILLSGVKIYFSTAPQVSAGAVQTFSTSFVISTTKAAFFNGALDPIFQLQIGATNATAPNTVYKTIQAGALGLMYHPNQYDSYMTGNCYYDSSSAYRILYGGYAGTIFGSANGDFVWYYVAAAAQDTATSITQKMHFDGANGRLAIGTSHTTPAAALDILNGSINITRATGATSTPDYIDLGDSYSNGSTRDKCKIYLYNYSATEKYGFSVGSVGDIQYHSNAYHSFYIANTVKFSVSSNYIGMFSFVSGTPNTSYYHWINNSATIMTYPSGTVAYVCSNTYYASDGWRQRFAGGGSYGTGILTMDQGSFTFNYGAEAGAETVYSPVAYFYVTPAGLKIGSPSGSFMGAGTLNATGLYVNGVAVQTYAQTTVDQYLYDDASWVSTYTNGCTITETATHVFITMGVHNGTISSVHCNIVIAGSALPAPKNWTVSNHTPFPICINKGGSYYSGFAVYKGSNTFEILDSTFTVLGAGTQRGIRTANICYTKA